MQEGKGTKGEKEEEKRPFKKTGVEKRNSKGRSKKGD